MQKTTSKRISISGVGIHTGELVTMELLPAEEGEGIGFIRDDVGGGLRIPAHFPSVKRLDLATTLTKGNVSVSTVEHLMAALYAMEIDNLTVVVDGPELPILDGSASPLVSFVRCAGVVESGAKRRGARVTERVRVGAGDAWAELTPEEKGFSIDYTIVYENPHVATQRIEFTLTPEYFEEEVAPARTYGLLSDVSSMYDRGLAQGGSLRNAVIVGEDGVINPEGLRFPDECVRHKCLDAIGDLALFGLPLFGRFTAYKSGHRLNHLLVKELAKRTAYEIFEL